jgi:DNA polymerase III subunit gamma/tau
MLTRHVPLYLKHRPQTLEQLVGQTAVLTTLSNAINHDRISHAYLFTGPRGTGKTSSARILAKSLNCKASEKATVTPCLECTSCEEIKNCSSPAVIEIDAASNNSVDDARILIERAPLVAPGARFKVYIIDECHMLTKEAFNALLKTIEDPPPNVVFILATTEEHKVIPTIVSRCQRLMFRLVTQDDLLQHLRNVADKEQIEITDTAIDFVARRSGGGLRDALGLLDQASLLSSPGKPVDVPDLLMMLGALHEDVLLEMSEHVANRAGHELLTAAAKLLSDGREPAIVVQELARHFLNLAKASYLYDSPTRADAAASLIIGSPSYLEGLWAQAPKFERSELSQIVEALDRLEGTCRRTTQPAMHLEVGLLALCHRQDMVLLRELADRVAKLESGAPRTVAPQPAAPAPRPAPPSPAAPPPQPVAHTPAPQPAAPAPQPKPTAVAEMPSTLPVVNSVSIVQEQPPQAAPAPVPASTPSPEAFEEGGASHDEVDRVWSITMEELHRRNLPASSLFTQAAFPLSLNERDFVIGVNPVFLKNLEMKLDHFKHALHAATQKQLNVKLQATTTQPAPAAAAKPKPAQREERTPPPAPVSAGGFGGSETGGDDDYEEPDLAPRHKLDELPAPAAAAAPNLTAEERAKLRAEKAKDEVPDDPVKAKQTIVKEAYKLFEGPGSRQIG